jgi:hypothetical protein
VADTRATTHAAQTPPKKIARVEMSQGENGGHIIRHIHTQKIHAPEEFAFGKDESQKAHEHLATHLNMPMTNVGAGEGSEETTLESKEAGET